MRFSDSFIAKFIKLAGPFWSSKQKEYIRGLSIALFILTVMQIAIAVVITEWSADLFNALERRSMSGLTIEILVMVLIFIGNIIVTTSHFRVKRRLQLEWRAWLTDKLIDQWMNNARHYLVTHIQGPHDNPDGRIAEDARIATELAIDLVHSLFYALLLLVSFTKILWTLSGTILVFGIPIKGHLVWLAILYATSGSILGWWIGRHLTKATDVRQTVEANFRFGLVSDRENSLAIALVHGEECEHKRLDSLFSDITHAWHRQTDAWSRIFAFTSGYSVLSMAFPILISAPRFILGSISLGALMQSAQAFQQMAGALSWPVDNMARVAEWRASVERVLGLTDALQTLQYEIARTDNPERIYLKKTDVEELHFRDLCVSRLDGIVCVSLLNEVIKAKEHVLITGNTFTGSKLFKAIVGLWPWGSGHIDLPSSEVCFVPPLPYLPKGPLKQAITYPLVFAGQEQQLATILTQVGLSELREQLEKSENWTTNLTRAQQQRLGIARLLLQRPRWILLQEALDALSSDEEASLLSLIFTELPEATILNITNESHAQALYQRSIVLC